MLTPDGGPPVLRLGCFPEFALQRLQSFLGALHVVRPGHGAEVVHLPTGEQLDRLERGALDLAIVHGVDAPEGIDVEPLFAGERLTAFLSVGHRLASREILRPGDLRGDILLVASATADPTFDRALRALATSAGHEFAGVRQLAGTDPRDVLFAVAESGGVALGGPSAQSAAGQIGALVAARPIDPPRRLPDTMLAWRAGPSTALAPIVAAARDVARELRAHGDGGDAGQPPP